MKLTNNFLLEEFVPKEIFAKWGDKARWFIDPLLPMIAQGIRDYFGKTVTINNWHLGGNYNLSGFRPPDSSVGAEMSQHRFGRAMDIKIHGEDPLVIQEWMSVNHDKGNQVNPFWLHQVKCIESGTKTWTHLDIRDTGADKLFIVRV